MYINDESTGCITAISIILVGGICRSFRYFRGIPALRLKGDYLAIITLAFGEIIRVIILNMKITRGQEV